LNKRGNTELGAPIISANHFGSQNVISCGCSPTTPSFHTI
jgi:hypothetical protein